MTQPRDLSQAKGLRQHSISFVVESGAFAALDEREHGQVIRSDLSAQTDCGYVGM